MKGHGFYNSHAWMQAAGIGAALPLLARAASAVPLQPPLLVADYGSSQGRNSLRPMQVAIDGLRARAPHEPVTVVHVDQPGNDFASLFGLLNDSEESYRRTHAQTYAAAIGSSFFEPVLPPGSVTLGWSSFAAMWLTSVPPDAAGHVSALLAPPEVRALLQAQAEADWRRFLAARAGELRPGGRVVVLVPCPGGQGSVGIAPLMEIAAAALRRFVSEGWLSEAIRSRAFIPTLPRLGEQLRAPFASGRFAGLELDAYEDRPDFPDAAWERYCGDGDVAGLIGAYVGFFQATFLPSLLHSLEPFGSHGESKAIASGLEAALRQAIGARPHPCAQIPLHTVVLRRV